MKFALKTGCVNIRPKLQEVSVSEAGKITARFTDGTVFPIPNDLTGKMASASPEQLSENRILPDGFGIRFPLIDEDITTEGMYEFYRSKLKSKPFFAYVHCEPVQTKVKFVKRRTKRAALAARLANAAESRDELVK